MRLENGCGRLPPGYIAMRIDVSGISLRRLQTRFSKPRLRLFDDAKFQAIRQVFQWAGKIAAALHPASRLQGYGFLDRIRLPDKSNHRHQPRTDWQSTVSRLAPMHERMAGQERIVVQQAKRHAAYRQKFSIGHYGSTTTNFTRVPSGT